MCGMCQICSSEESAYRFSRYSVAGEHYVRELSCSVAAHGIWRQNAFDSLLHDLERLVRHPLYLINIGAGRLSRPPIMGWCSIRAEALTSFYLPNILSLVSFCSGGVALGCPNEHGSTRSSALGLRLHPVALVFR